MVTDRYTKGVLTVIAVTLIYIGAMVSGRPLSAQSNATVMTAQQLADARPQPVVIVGWGTMRSDGQITLTTVKDQRGVVRTDPAVPVKVSEMPERAVDVTLGVTAQHPLPVGLVAVSPGPDWEPIRTKAEPEPTRPKPGGGQ
jgi:hypothetical protein